MEILKVINNNVVSAYDDQKKEVVLMGKGIGFGKKPGDSIEKGKVEKIFSLPGEHTSQFENLVANMPYEHIHLADETITYAQKTLGRKLNRNIYITLTDHMNFAIERQKKGIVFSNALLWEIKKYYPDEFSIGLHTIDRIKETLDIELPEDEAGFIALHIVNAETDGESTIHEVQKIPAAIKDILNIVRYSFPEQMDENSLAYERFLTHLKFFLQRALSDQSYDDVDEELYGMLQKRYPKAYACAKKIARYMSERRNYTVPEEEMVYLITHIARVARQ